MSGTMNDPVVYRKVIFSKWDVLEEPDDTGAYQVKCRNCGSMDVHYLTGSKIPWCPWCGAYMVEGYLPDDVLTASEVAADVANE